MDKSELERLQDARKTLARSVGQLAESARQLLDPLRSLSDEQRDALAILVYLLRVIRFARRSPVRIDESIVQSLVGEVDEVCPPMPALEWTTGDPCLDASFEYAEALQKCKEDGKDEEECPEAWGPGAATVMCLMGELESMKQEIGDILGRQTPPKPIPWPVNEV